MGNIPEQVRWATEKISTASIPEGVCDALTDFTGQFGLDHAFAATIPPLGTTLKVSHLLATTYPAEFMARYIAENWIQIDPTVRLDGNPFFWRSSMANRITKDLFGVAAEHGMKAGLMLPFAGSNLMIGLCGEKIDVPPAELTAIGMASAVAMGCAMELRRNLEQHPPLLTARELECLKWAAEGKTEWEIGEILTISEHTAARHLSSAQHKLKAINRAHAIALAMRWRLIR